MVAYTSKGEIMLCAELGASVGVDSVLVEEPASSLLMSCLSCSQVVGMGTVEAETAVGA